MIFLVFGGRLGGDGALQEESPFLLADGKVIQNLPPGCRVDHGPKEVFRVLHGTHRQAFGRRAQPLQDVVVVFLQDDQARTGGAFLPLVAEGRLQYVDDGLVEVGIGVKDDGVLAAHFGDYGFYPERPLTGPGCELHQAKPRLLAAGKGNERYVGVGDQVIANLAASAGQEIEHSRRQVHLLEQLVKHGSHDGGLGGRFVNNGIAADDGCSRHTHGNGKGEIPGSNNHRDPFWFIHELADFPRRMSHACWRAQTQHFAAVIFEKIDRLTDIGIGFPPSFTDFQHVQCSQFAAASADLPGGLEQMLGADPEIGIPPSGKGLLGGSNGPLDLVDTGSGNVPQHLQRLVGIDRDDLPHGLYGLPSNHEREFSRKAFTNACQGFREPFAMLGHRPIPQRFITKRTPAAKRLAILFKGGGARAFLEDFQRASQ